MKTSGRSSKSRRALTRRKTPNGVPLPALVVEIVIGVAGLWTMTYQLVGVALALHAFIRWLVARDPLALHIYMTFVREPDYIDPMPRRSVFKRRPRFTMPAGTAALR